MLRAQHDQVETLSLVGSFFAVPGRTRAWLGVEANVRAVIAVSIAVVSVLGALVAWQATVIGEEAAKSDGLGLQEVTLRVQEEAKHQATVDEDVRIFALYHEHIDAAALLSADADRVRQSDPRLATNLDAQAQDELLLARTVHDYFQAARWIGPNDTSYPTQYVLDYLNANDPNTEKIRPEADFARGRALHWQTVLLIGLVAVFVAALVFLTLAQLSRRQLRPLFASAGFAVTGLGLLLWTLIGVVAT